ncbi:MAG: hypothetical protein ACE5HT_11935 [Gemmatimonadales bacterium]
MLTWYLDNTTYVLFLEKVGDLWGLDATDYVHEIAGPKGAVRF